MRGGPTRSTCWRVMCVAVSSLPFSFRLRHHQLSSSLKKVGIIPIYLPQMKALLCSLSLLSYAVLSGLLVPGSGQSSPAPAPLAAALVNSGNTTGSIAYYCSTRANLQALLSSPSNQASAGLGVTIPANLSDPASIQTIAQVPL